MISIRLMRIPHLSVTASICCCTSVLMRSRSDSASSSVIVPITERSAVRARASIADVEVGDAEQRLLRDDDLREDRRVHGDHDVVLGDHVLAVTRPRDLAHVDALQRLDERA